VKRSRLAYKIHGACLRTAYACEQHQQLTCQLCHFLLIPSQLWIALALTGFGMAFDFSNYNVTVVVIDNSSHDMPQIRIVPVCHVNVGMRQKSKQGLDNIFAINTQSQRTSCNMDGNNGRPELGSGRRLILTWQRERHAWKLFFEVNAAACSPDFWASLVATSTIRINKIIMANVDQ
jgi:hypothetical protein